MKKKRWKLLALIVILLVLLFRGTSFFGERGAGELTDHPWLERMPKDPRDQISQLLFIEKRSRRIGVFSRGSAYRFELDFVSWKLDGDRLTVLFLQDEQKRSYRAKTWACQGDAPRGFDLCLELVDSNGKNLRYYTRKSWKTGSDLPAEVSELGSVLERAELPATGD